MRIRNTSFTIDTTSISTAASTSKTAIHLPYTGPLPDTMQNVTSAAVHVNISAGLTVNVILSVESGGTGRRHCIEATPEEINNLLHPLFFDASGHTRNNNGLDRYHLGFWQASYINWKRIVLDAHGLDNLLFQLSPASVSQIIDHIRQSAEIE